MLSARAIVFFAVLPIAAGVVLTHRITPVLSARTSHLLLRDVNDASAKRGEANVTIEYQQGAYEWYMIDIQLGTPRKNRFQPAYRPAHPVNEIAVRSRNS